VFYNGKKFKISSNTFAIKDNNFIFALLKSKLKTEKSKRKYASKN